MSEIIILKARQRLAVHYGILRDYLSFLAGDSSHSWSVSLVFAHFIVSFRSPVIMSVSNEVQQSINTSLAKNNKALLDQISKLVADSAKNIKRDQ